MRSSLALHRTHRTFELLTEAGQPADRYPIPVSRDPADTCWTVLRAAARGDDAARSTFSHSYLKTVRDFLRQRWRGRVLMADVDDASQEVFVECLKPGGALEVAEESRGEFRGLLFGVVRNVARRFEERASKRGRLRHEDSAWLEHVAADEPGQATMFDRSWARTLMRQAKRRHRELAIEADGEAGRRRIELLERRFGDDQAIRQIAAAWGVDPKEVHTAYRKARTEFYRCLREAVGFHACADADLDSECRRLLSLLR